MLIDIRLRTRFWQQFSGVCVILMIAGADVSAQTQKSKETSATGQKSTVEAGSRDKERAGIRKTVDELVAAFAKGDAEAAAAVLTDEAELIPFAGESVIGRGSIQKAYESHFAKHPQIELKLTTASLRFLSRNAAVEEGTMQVTFGEGAPRANHYSLLHLREDGKWLIGEIRESPADDEGLGELGWIIGDWTAKQGDTELNIKYDWFGDKAFLRGTFTIKFNERTVTGMQLIGADPQTGELKIWVFEHDGGYAAGTCTRDGESWLFQTSGAFSTGEEWSARNVLLRVNNETFTWQPVLRTIGEERVEDAPPIKVVRAKSSK